MLWQLATSYSHNKIQPAVKIQPRPNQKESLYYQLSFKTESLITFIKFLVPKMQSWLPFFRFTNCHKTNSKHSSCISTRLDFSFINKENRILGTWNRKKGKKKDEKKTKISRKLNLDTHVVLAGFLMKIRADDGVGLFLWFSSGSSPSSWSFLTLLPPLAFLALSFFPRKTPCRLPVLVSFLPFLSTFSQI